jgi:ABC-type Fe3+-hydroxamate transport system substrate-binding protein
VTSPPRIACLVPSITELLAVLGLGPRLVARTGFCVHPAEVVAAVPKVGGTKDVNLDKLRRLAPTHVIVNVDENTWPTVQALRAFVPEVIVTHPCAPQDVLDLIAQLAATFAAEPGVIECGEALRDELRSALDEARAAHLPATPVLYLIWRDPWMTVARDTYISRLLGLANWRTWPDAQGGATGAARYPALRGDEPGLAAVREVLLSSEPYAFDESHRQQAQVLCPNARVRLVDGELLSWYGPRTAAGVRYALSLANTALA